MLRFTLRKRKRPNADAVLLRAARAHDRHLVDLARLRAAYDEAKAALTKQALCGSGAVAVST